MRCARQRGHKAAAAAAAFCSAEGVSSTGVCVCVNHHTLREEKNGVCEESLK